MTGDRFERASLCHLPLRRLPIRAGVLQRSTSEHYIKDKVKSFLLIQVTKINIQNNKSQYFDRFYALTTLSTIYWSHKTLGNFDDTCVIPAGINLKPTVIAALLLIRSERIISHWLA